MVTPGVQSAERFIDVGAGKIYSQCWIPPDLAAPEPIILMHDSLGCVKLWRDFPRRLCEATGRVIIAYDRLGFGLSDPRGGPLPFDFIGEDPRISLPALIKDYSLNDFILFGHSVGGGMAAIGAAKYGAKCIGVITESAQAFNEDKTRAAIHKAKYESGAGSRIGRLEKYHGPKAEWVFKSWVDTWLSPNFAAWELGPEIQNIKCPLLAIHGDRDEYGSRKHPEAICANAGGLSRMIILQDCGHIPHREKPDEVLKIVSDFIHLEIAGALSQLPPLF